MKKVFHYTQEKIKDLDKLGDQFVLTQQNRPQYSTVFGGILSCLATLFGTTIIILFIIEYFDNTNPDLSEIYRRTDIYPKISLYDEKYAPGFVLRSGKNVIPPKDHAKYMTVKFVTFQLTGFGDQVEENLIYEDMIPCALADKELYSKLYNSPTLKDFFLAFGICIDAKDPSKLFVASSPTTVPYQRHQIEIHPCSLPNPADCATPADFIGLSVVFAKPDVAFDPTNYKNPLSFSIDSDLLLAFDITQSYSWESSFRTNEIYDERYDFIGEQFFDSFIDIESVFTRGVARPSAQLFCTLDQIKTFACVPFFKFDFKSGNQVKKIKRTYKMILDTLGNMGGIFEIMFAIAAILYCCYKDRARRVYMHTIVHQKSLQEYSQVFNEANKKMVDEAMVDMIEWQQDAGRLVDKLVSYRALEAIVMKPCHRVLNPVIAVAEEVERKKKIKKAEKDAMFLLAEGARQSESKMSLHQAYNELKRLEAQYEEEGRQGFARDLNRHYIKTLEPYFGENAQEKLPENAFLGMEKGKGGPLNYNHRNQVAPKKLVKKQVPFGKIDTSKTEALGTSQQKSSQRSDKDSQKEKDEWKRSSIENLDI